MWKINTSGYGNWQERCGWVVGLLVLVNPDESDLMMKPSIVYDGVYRSINNSFLSTWFLIDSMLELDLLHVSILVIDSLNRIHQDGSEAP